jgi:guanylate kinase
MSKFIIISAPSGSGKSTLASYLLSNISSLSFSVSSTTRKIRSNEIDGVDYYFISNKEFKENIEKQNFVEWQQVYNSDYKGTLKTEINRLVSKGKHIIFDVDVVGGLNLKKYFGKDSLSIFIDVPSFKVLENRLNIRGTELKENIQERLNKAKKEILEKEKFDVIIMNDNIEKSKNEIFDLVSKFLN